MATKSKRPRKKEGSKRRKSFFAPKWVKVFFVLLVGGILFLIADLYKKVYYPNINLKDKQTGFIFIPTGASYEDVLSMLHERNLLQNFNTFNWLAKKVNYPQNVHPGKYLIKKDMSNKDLLYMLRSGRQTPVRLTFNNVRTKEELASRFSKELEPDSMTLMQFLNNDEYISKFGFSGENVLSMFIPNTYEFYWNTAPKFIFEKIYKEYSKFWSKENLLKAEKIKMTPLEVSVLASIVEQETHKNDEKKIVAGVYMNRLKKGHKLEADPTLIYALGDFKIKRVLNVHKELDSPYNTYKYPGLPPGPICMPSISSLKAVLNYERHDYFFFCAREDFSGYHVFSRNYNEHLCNARRYQKELNKRNIGL